MLTQLLLPIVMILGAVGVVIGFINPQRAALAIDKQTATELEAALAQVNQLGESYKRLRDERNQIQPEDIVKLETMLPSNVNNMRLVLEVEKIATSLKLGLKDIKVDTGATGTSQTTGGVGSVGVSFTLVGNYKSFVKFMEVVEKSLRVLDVESIDFTPPRAGIGSSSNDQYEFKVNVRTYWLPKVVQ